MNELHAMHTVIYVAKKELDELFKNITGTLYIYSYWILFLTGNAVFYKNKIIKILQHLDKFANRNALPK